MYSFKYFIELCKLEWALKKLILFVYNSRLFVFDVTSVKRKISD